MLAGAGTGGLKCQCVKRGFRSSFKGLSGGSRFDCEGNAVPQFGSNQREHPVSSEWGRLIRSIRSADQRV